MNKRAFLLLTLLLLVIVPLISIAATPARNQVTNLYPLMCEFLKWIWVGFIGLAIIMFMWAGFMFLTASGDPSKVAAARTFIILGITGVIVAIVGFSSVEILGKMLYGTVNFNTGCVAPVN